MDTVLQSQLNRGMRVTVGMIVGQIGAGHSVEEILTDYTDAKALSL